MNDIVTLPAPVGELDRRTYIGGSDIAAIMGLSPWKTPLALWEEKVGVTPPEPISEEKRKFFARRKRQEPVVAEMLLDTYGIEVTKLSLDGNPNRYTDPDHRFLAAEIDFEFRMSDAVRAAFPDRPEFCAIPNGTLLNGEIKTVHPFKAHEWGEQGSEDVPIHYAAQVMHGLGITRRPAGLVAALFGLDTLLAFPVMADPDTIAAMRARAVSFWIDNVQGDLPPDPLSTEDIKRMYAGFSGKPVELSQEANDALNGLESLRVREAQIKQDRAELEWRIARCIAFNWGAMVVPDEKGKPIVKSEENAALMFEGRPVGTWNRQRGVYLDQKRLAAEKPDVIENYSVEHKYRVFRLKKEKRK